jgi:hypothetical protein
MSEPKCLAGPIEWAFALTERRINSIHRLKRIGDKGQPCLTPDKIGIDEVLPAGVRTSVDAFVYMLPMRVTTESGTPRWVRVVEMTSCGTLPKALRGSSHAR